MPKAKVGLLKRLEEERIFGEPYGVPSTLGMDVAFELCRHRGIRKIMLKISAVVLIVVPIHNTLFGDQLD